MPGGGGVPRAPLRSATGNNHITKIYIYFLLQSLRMQPALTFDKPWKTGYLLDHVQCANDLTWIPQDYQLVIKTEGGLLQRMRCPFYKAPLV